MAVRGYALLRSASAHPPEPSAGSREEEFSLDKHHQPGFVKRSPGGVGYSSPNLLTRCNETSGGRTYAQAMERVVCIAARHGRGGQCRDQSGYGLPDRRRTKMRAYNHAASANVVSAGGSAPIKPGRVSAYRGNTAGEAPRPEVCNEMLLAV